MQDIRTDLLVAGGGLAGCFAAIAAKRTSPDITVWLVERYGFLGGMATAGYVFPFMRYYTGYTKDNPEPKRLIGGLFQEMNDLMHDNGYTEPKASVRDFYSRFDPVMIRCILDKMVKDAGVNLLFHGLVNQVNTESSGKDGQKISSVTVQTKAGPIKFNPKVIIDSTGDADIIFHAGGKWEMGREEDGLVQPATLNFRIGNIDPDHCVPAFNGFYRREIAEKAMEEKKAGNPLTPRDDCLMFFAGNNQYHFNQTRVAGFDFTDPFDRSKAEIEGRAQAERYIKFLRDKIEGYENSTVVGMGAELGVRESRRIIGEYVFTEEDLMGCKKFDGRIALGNYPVDIHDPKGSATTDIRRIPEGDWYTIPYLSLVPKGLVNALVAGRPISSTHVAHSAMRVMPICSAIGHAAGVAAGLILSRFPNIALKEVPVGEIQKTLRSQGAILE
ncbi:MAG: FAD-dependent oxidoreductase [Candidatus Hodarchaeota archaeon]